MERIKQKLDAARIQRERLQQGHTDAAESVGHHNWSTFRSEKRHFMSLKGNNAWFLLGTTVIIMSAMIAWWGVSSNDHDASRLSGIEELDSQRDSKTSNSAVEEVDLKIAALTDRVNTLTESISQLEIKLISVHLTTDAIITAKAAQPPTTNTSQQTIAKTEHILETLPPPASGITEKETKMAIAPRLSSDEIASDSSVTPAAMERQPTIKTDKSGPWVINLVSTSSKADADRLSKKAHSKDILTELQPITVKGTQYWRVQVTGFITAEDARAYADTAKAQLGLKDAWIMKR